MNPTKAAAILSLIVALCAAGDLAYQALVVRARFVEMGEKFDKCEAQMDEARRQGKDPRAVWCPDVKDVAAPSYAAPSGIAIVWLIASLGLFKAAKPSAQKVDTLPKKSG
jgi:hypothetical protein